MAAKNPSKWQPIGALTTIGAFVTIIASADEFFVNLGQVAPIVGWAGAFGGVGWFAIWCAATFRDVREARNIRQRTTERQVLADLNFLLKWTTSERDPQGQDPDYLVQKHEADAVRAHLCNLRLLPEQLWYRDDEPEWLAGRIVLVNRFSVKAAGDLSTVEWSERQWRAVRARVARFVLTRLVGPIAQLGIRSIGRRGR